MNRTRRMFLGSAGALLLGACREPKAREHHVGGAAFGTTWSVTWLGSPELVAPGKIEAILEELDRVFSGWRPDSEVSRFNRHPAGSPFPASAGLLEVVLLARRVHDRSRGCFDPTVGPLVAAYGFGPAEAADAAAVPCFDAIRIDPGRGEITKTRPDATLDLSGIAKGHAVDLVLEALRGMGAENALVEIGGETRAVGPGPDGSGWPVGVQLPDGSPGQTGQVVRLRDEAMVTSGTYWQRRETDHGTVSHLIDPRTRRPVGHDTVSVTVIGPTAAEADAWATALLVMGSAEGPAVAEREGLEALFLRKPPEDGSGTRAHE